MGGAVSSGRDNNELIDNLMGGNYIRTRSVEQVFRALDRADYMTRDCRDQAYKDLAWRSGALHLSAPCIYSKVMEGLELKPGLSFLNIGSGTGYLSTLVGLILGSSGINHGVELFSQVVDYSNRKLGQFLENSPTLDEFDLCEPKFYCGNGLCLAPLQTPYDRVYCGAGCPEEYQNYFKQLIKIGGILVVPLNDNLIQVRRLSETEWLSKPLLSVSFASLRVPPRDQPQEMVKLEEQCPARLQALSRASVRAAMRAAVLSRRPELREPPRPVRRNHQPRRICIPLDDDSDVENLNMLHDLDATSGANEMNALLSLVLSMGQNRGAGALRFDPQSDSDRSSRSDRSSTDFRSERSDRSHDSSDDDDDDDGDDGDDGNDAPPYVLESANRLLGSSPTELNGNGNTESDTTTSSNSRENSNSISTPSHQNSTTNSNQNSSLNGNSNSKESNSNPSNTSDRPPIRSVFMFEFRDHDASSTSDSANDSTDKSIIDKSTTDKSTKDKKDTKTKKPDSQTQEATEVEILLEDSEQPGTSTMEWERASDGKREHSSDDETTDSIPKLKEEKRQKFDSGIGEENTPSGDTSPAKTEKSEDSDGGEFHRSSLGGDGETEVKGRRRQKRARGQMEEQSTSSASECECPARRVRRRGERVERAERGERGESAERGERGERAERGERGERGPATTTARRVQLSIAMKRAVKELPLPYPLKKYINYGRCFQF